MTSIGFLICWWTQQYAIIDIRNWCHSQCFLCNGLLCVVSGAAELCVLISKMPSSCVYLLYTTHHAHPYPTTHHAHTKHTSQHTMHASQHTMHASQHTMHTTQCILDDSWLLQDSETMVHTAFMHIFQSSVSASKKNLHRWTIYQWNPWLLCFSTVKLNMAWEVPVVWQRSFFKVAVKTMVYAQLL